MLKRLGAHRAYLPLLVGLLVLTFVLTAVLAYSAQDADRRHREAAEAALRDYTELAAEGFSGQFAEGIVNGLSGVYMQVRRAELLRGGVPSRAQLLSILADSLLCHCTPSSEIRTRLYFDSTTVVQVGQAIPPDDLMLLRERATRAPRAVITPGWGVGAFEIPFDSSAAMVAVLVETDSSGELVRAFAYQLTNQAVQLYAHFIFSREPLPFASAPGAVPNDSLFHVAVRGVAGEIFSLGNGAGTNISASSMLAGVAGGLPVSVTLRAGAADRLIPGGMPQPRLPFLLLILGVTGLSLIAAVFVLRREAELMRMRSDFVASVSHELRTPLAQIRMFTETLLLGRVRSDIERRRALEIIEQEARRLAHLVENVLTFGRGTQRRARLAPEAMSFAEEVQRIVASFATLREAQDADLRLELQDDIVVPVDRDALRQIMINLVDNALKYGPPHQRITIGTALFGDAARLWVDDEGTGVPPAERERVFESFHRLSRDVDRAVTGSGIGLAVVRELTRLHGGTTWIEDAPGGGARVVAEFPGAYVRGAETAAGWAVA
jgi:signal transduction histidine kinase